MAVSVRGAGLGLLAAGLLSVGVAGGCSRADDEVPTGGAGSTTSFAKPRPTGLDTTGTTRPLITGTTGRGTHP